jgi:sialic acid synthase SpsE
VHVEIGGRPVGAGLPFFLIAELGLNHGGSVARALDLVDAAAAAGASAIKVQSFTADSLVAPSCPAPAHVPEPSLRDFFRRFELDEDAHRTIVERARARGLAVLATPFSLEAVDMLERVGVDAYKIASGDLTYDALIARSAATRLPLVVSTGMGTLEETAHAVSQARAAGACQIALMHCVSAYPTPEGSQNLRAIATLLQEFGVPVGFSDHARTTWALPLAIALGASLYERHLMLPDDRGVDADVSSLPSDLAAAVAAARRTIAALGHGRRECLPAEAANLIASRRGLHAARALEAGHVVNAGDIAVLRPCSGLSPARQPSLVGSVLSRDIEAGAPFTSVDLCSTGSACAVA